MNEQMIYHQPITEKRILLFTFPTILMTLIQSSYSMIDGIFISNIMGDMALSSLTLISPYFNFFIAIAAMFVSGGSAIVMRKMGEKKEREARQDFTSLLLTNLAIGGLLTILTMLFTNSLVEVFHVSKTVTSFCKEYLFTYIFFIIPQLLFQICKHIQLHLELQIVLFMILLLNSKVKFYLTVKARITLSYLFVLCLISFFDTP